MSDAPGSGYYEEDAVTPRTPNTNTGQGIFVAPAAKGPTTPTKIESMTAFDLAYGGDVTYSELRASVEQFFRHGGRVAYVIRRVGPAAKAAELVLKDAANADSLKVTASSPGDWGNALSVAIIAGTGSAFIIAVSDASGELVRSDELADKPAAVAWADALAGTGKDLIRVSALAGAAPKPIVATPLATGTDDRAAITDATLGAALAQLDEEKGPGQVTAPGLSTVAGHTALALHAEEFGRFAILDLPATFDEATIATHIGQLRTALGKTAAHAFPVLGRGIVSTPIGTTKTVPGSAIVAGLMARVDALGNPNLPAAGKNGIADGLLGITHEFTDKATRARLNDLGANVFRTIQGQVRLYGYRTLAAKSTYKLYWRANNVRLDMAIRVKALAIAEDEEFAQIDGGGVEAANYGGKLAAMLKEYHRIGALYGATPDEAYRVQTDSAINTPDTIEDGRLIAKLSLKRSPFAERAEVLVAKVATTDAV